MRNQNGVHVYEPGEDPHFPVPLKSMQGSKYGFKLTGAGAAAKWIPATEEDFRSSESRRLGIAPADVDERTICRGDTHGGCDFSSCDKPQVGCYRVVYNHVAYCVCSG